MWTLGEGEDEAALAWVAQLDAADGAAPVVRRLRQVVEAPDNRLSAPIAEAVLAAAELVAALHGYPHPAMPDAARRWVEAQPPRPDAPDLDALVGATQALDLVATSSELSEVWSERIGEARWRAGLDDLRMRLAAAGGMRRTHAGA